MKSNNNIVASIAETSKIGFAGILAGAFCLIFAVIFTIVHYARGENK
jgi:hypothetical protein